jgi:hypothetical protein
MVSGTEEENMKTKILGFMVVVVLMAVIGCQPEPTPEHVHQWGDWTVTTPATETAEGIETKTCSTCGEKETRPIDKLTHTHQFGTAWVKNATQHWHECSCGEKADIANHTWDWVVTTPATPTTDGVETRTCSICGEEETRTIDKLPTCECPNGTVHPYGQPCCGTEDCTCTEAQNPDLIVEERSTTINLFEGKTATVKGVFDKAGLDTAAGTIKTALNNRFNTAGAAAKDSFKNVFSRDVTIIIEKTSEYANFKTIGDGKTMYINFGILNDASVLESAINNARLAMAGYDVPATDGPPVPGTTPEIQAPVTKDLSFGTGCKVTIKSDEKFLEADWNALCAKAVAAVERGHGAASSNAAKNEISAYFKDYTVVIVLSGAADAKKCEVKGDVTNTIYLKADAAIIDGIIGNDFLNAIYAVLDSESFQLAKAKIVPAGIARCQAPFWVG